MTEKMAAQKDRSKISLKKSSWTKSSYLWNEFTNAFVKISLIDGFCQYNAYKLNTAGEINIRFDSFSVDRPQIAQPESVLENIDCSFDGV